MKFNKWTVGLAAAGIVTLPSLAKADQPNLVQTAAANTTLSGYVDTSAQWNIGRGNSSPGSSLPGYAFGGASKADGFSLNVVDLALDKPQDETPWAAGYHVELWLGPDANALNTLSTSSSGTTADFAIRQAYVALRTPIGNGIDWKVGVFDSPLGYESTSSPNDPNFTRSYGYSIEPTELTGIMGTYKFCDEASFSAGVANTIDATINERDQFGFKEDTKAYFASLTLTAPQNWGWLAGSTMSAGVIHGFSGAAIQEPPDGPDAGNVTHIYAGVSLATPVTGLKVGAALDYRHAHDAGDISGEYQGDTWVYGLYASWQATEKFSLHVRGEYMDDRGSFFTDVSDLSGMTDTQRIMEFTVTAQYDLWKNVLSRVEARWDRSVGGGPLFGGTTGTPDQRNAFILAANVIYKF